jgi:hypothetical protein
MCVYAWICGRISKYMHVYMSVYTTVSVSVQQYPEYTTSASSMSTSATTSSSNESLHVSVFAPCLISMCGQVTDWVHQHGPACTQYIYISLSLSHAYILLWYLGVYAYMYMCTYSYMCTYKHTHIYIDKQTYLTYKLVYAHTYTRTCIGMHRHIHAYTHVHMYMYICVCVCKKTYTPICIYMYLYVYVYVYIHIYLHTNTHSICYNSCLFIHVCVCERAHSMRCPEIPQLHPPPTNRISRYLRILCNCQTVPTCVCTYVCPTTKKHRKITAIMHAYMLSCNTKLAHNHRNTLTGMWTCI